MSDNGSALLVWLSLSGALLAFLVQLALALALSAASSLSRVGLQRLSAESNGRLRFLSGLKDAASPHRAAADLARQGALLCACVLLGVAAGGAGLPYPFLIAWLGAVAFGLLLLEAGVARAVSLRRPRRTLRVTAWSLRAAHALLRPLLGPLDRWLGAGAPPAARRDDEREDEAEEEVEALIEVGEREGILEAAEGRMMRSIADLDETLVREIMTPRTDILALPVETRVAAAREVLIEGGHSKVPVYREVIDDVVGVLHARDLFHAWHDGHEQAGVEDYLRPTLFVPETLTVAELLGRMRLKTRIAMVVDEYGGIAGLVTMEDLLEEIVGDIRDEHDLEEHPLEEQSDGSWLVSGVAHVKELEERFGIEVGARDFDTVGGLVVSRFGRVPRQGERLTTHGLRIEVLESDGKRVYRVRVQPGATGAGSGAASRG